ncbi:MAG: 30S ribosomal protein S1 [Candidatus Magnetoovum sp. WYHC-5]|nr:30S ribosomal protein S1 [Candidatus Magnetoovum sp. WYHC-5]
MEVHDNDMEQLYAETFRGIEVGMILNGKVVAKKATAVVVDIGYKSEGFIPIEEFTQEELNVLKEGDTIEVLVSDMKDAEGIVNLSKARAKRIITQQKLQKSFDEDEIVEGKIVDKTKGGFFVDINGVKAFLPGSQFDVKPVKFSDDVVGMSCRFKILKLNSKLNNVIVSRRAVIEEEKTKKREETKGRIKEGSIIKGTVKNITDYGVFVDLGEIDGLLHISDISWGRIDHPSDVFSVGQEIEVIVLKYDVQNAKVTLGFKQKKQDPWIDIDTRYADGKKVEGKVVGLTDYGAFVELEEGVEGLVHVSELDWSSKPGHPSKYIEVGDVVHAVVLKVDKGQRRISLGIKQLKPKPWELVAQKYRVGQRVTGKVRTITDFGIFVGMPEGVDALIHISDISWTKHIRHPSEVFKLRQKVEAVILSLEPDKERMLLGIKQLDADPWIEQIPTRFKLGDEVECKVLRVTEHGIFVDIEDSVEGLVYASEVVKREDGEQYKESDMIKARIIKMDFEQKKIGLSMFPASRLEEDSK